MNKNYIFKKPLTKSNNEYIELKFLLDAENTISTNEFLKTYKISNFWKGKFFINKLIKRIFKYKLKQQIKWEDNFWETIKIYHSSYIYTLPRSIKSLDDLYLELSKGDTKKRFKDIMKYKNLIYKGIDINFPLFITGKVLKIIGAEVNDDDIFFLDGTRRLLANILVNQNNNKAIIIDI